ncbi:hypothetical protein [Streptomyces sp. NBRC 109706]|uniref:hypothetical protein n=1 Tax=Streptomyces sp. NBRC 109706 TaxID=1550035 RepID=UPI000829A8DD|nr:hypothetical protein [Streptomyces sp. NBRC 109706]
MVLYVVTGPPTAGKSAWITGRARPRDIVIDLDRIALALAGPGADDHDHDPHLLRVAHKARFAAIKEATRISTGEGQSNPPEQRPDVYLIHTQPSVKQRARYHRQGARIIVVDPGRDITMARVRQLRQPSMERVAARWYEQHTHTPRGATVVNSRGSRNW